MNDKTDVILAVALKPIGAKAQYILYIRKTKGFFSLLFSETLGHSPQPTLIYSQHRPLPSFVSASQGRGRWPPHIQTSLALGRWI